MKTLHTALALTLLLNIAGAPLRAEEMSGMKHDMPGMPGDSMGDMKGHAMSGMDPQSPMVNTHRAQGTVVGVDAQMGKINLSHGPIQSLNWPAMTMSFAVKDAALLKDIQPGMKVDFELEKSDSAYRVISIKPVS